MNIKIAKIENNYVVDTYFMSQAEFSALDDATLVRGENNTEIGDIGWYNIDEALLKIRDYNIDKKSKLLYLHKMIKNTLENFLSILNDFLQFL